MNKIPFLSPLYARRPVLAIVPHLFGTTVFAETAWPLAAYVYAWETLIPRVYGRCEVMAISESTRDDLVRRGIPTDRVIVIHPGVDSRTYRPDPATPRAARPTFLYLGRLKRYKGVEYALRALAAARQVHPDVTLDICGQGDDRARLEGVVETLGLSDAVRFRGFVSEDDKRTLLRRAWAVVFPSPKEGWGITNVEAAASGTPALASDSPGLRESVRHEITGYLVPHGDWRALADRMAALASDPALVERLGRAARQFAEGLSWDGAAEATLAHLQQTIGEQDGKD